MNWTHPIDNYCERLGPGFWAEPLNAISNVAFILAAVVGVVLWLRQPASGEGAALPGRSIGLWLAFLVGVIGIGSFLFHSFANRWSSLADVIPIAIFIYAYFGTALHRLAGLTGPVALGATVLFLAASLVADPALAHIFGSSSGYVPALLAMLGIGGVLVARKRAGGGLILAAAATFAASLGFRMADLPLCPDWPLGTHFTWHILNAITLGLLLVALSSTSATLAGSRPLKEPSAG